MNPPAQRQPDAAQYRAEYKNRPGTIPVGQPPGDDDGNSVTQAQSSETRGHHRAAPAELGLDGLEEDAKGAEEAAQRD